MKQYQKKSLTLQKSKDLRTGDFDHKGKRKWRDMSNVQAPSQLQGNVPVQTPAATKWKNGSKARKCSAEWRLENKVAWRVVVLASFFRMASASPKDQESLLRGICLIIPARDPNQCSKEHDEEIPS